MFHGRAAAWWIVPGAVMLACLYAPTLTTRFDFNDDGNLVYAAPPGTTPAGYWQRYVAQVEVNHRVLGPFRPVLWAHWELAANTLGDNAPAWRSLRLAWTALAAAMLLWFLHELGFHPLACLGAAALSMWNPWRNEIWTSLTLAEGVAMPYAVFALVAALRAGRSPRPWLWVAAACWASVMALGCKNTFAALVPVQLFLCAYPQAGSSWREALRRTWPRLAVLGLTFALPVLHYVHFRLNWQPGNYRTDGLTFDHIGRQLHSLWGAMSPEFIGAGVVLGLLALVLSARPGTTQASWTSDVGAAWRSVWDEYRLPCLAGVLLLVAGLAVYLPFDGIAGRYNIPAAWGADVLLAALLSALLRQPRTAWVRLAGGAFAVGLAAVGVANIGKQHRAATRAEMLWGVVEYLETHADAGDHVAWVVDDQMSPDEGVHLLWHLKNRGRCDVQVSLIDRDGNAMPRLGVPAPTCAPTHWVSSGEVEDVPGAARRRADFRTYPLARKPYHCVLWQRRPTQRYVDAGPLR